jgi:hypothetical protein
MSHLGNLKRNLYEIQNDLFELEKGKPFGYEFCDIIKDLNAVQKGCVKFKNVVMKKEVLPSRYVKPVGFMIEGDDESQLNDWIDHLNKSILNLDDSLRSSKNYNDIYKFVRHINAIEKNALKIINHIKQLDRSFQQQGGAWDDDIKRNMEELSSIGKEIEDKLVHTSSIIDGIESEYQKMKPIYDEKMKIYADNCFPECSISDGKWAGQASCTKDIAQERKAREYFNDNLSRKPGNIFLDKNTKNIQEIDPLYRCKSSAAQVENEEMSAAQLMAKARALRNASSDAVSLESAAAFGKKQLDCFPKCALNDLGQWKGTEDCLSTDEVDQEARARTKWKRENARNLTDDDKYQTVIDPKYRCSS